MNTKIFALLPLIALLATQSAFAQDDALNLAVRLAFPKVVSGEETLLLSQSVTRLPAEDCANLLETEEALRDEDLASAVRAYCAKPEVLQVQEAGLDVPYVIVKRSEIAALWSKLPEARWRNASAITELGQAGLSESGQTLVFWYLQTWGPENCYGQFHVFKRKSLETPFIKEKDGSFLPYPVWRIAIC